MTDLQDSKFGEPSDLIGEWHDSRQFHFWHDQDPFAVKHLIETMTGTLFQRDAGDAGKLAYAGIHVLGNRTCALRLCFVAVIASHNLYTLQLESTAPRKWVAQASFLHDLERMCQHWRSQQLLADEEIDWSRASRALLDQRTQESLALEFEAAALVEDPAPAAAIQDAVLAAMRAGREFRTASKEGGTILCFQYDAFIRTDYGEQPRREIFPTDEAMLACLRNFYDWDSRRDSYPHRLPESDVWRYIQNQLREKPP